MEGKGEACLDVPAELRFPYWLRTLIEELSRRTFRLRHPQGKEWFVVFQLDYQPNALPTGKLLIRPAVTAESHRASRIGLVEDRPLVFEDVERRLRVFLRKHR